jgi:antibiotic biosynthesis monooxygenase (ABM) superfamily enzyme
MITRIWHGRTRAARAREYLEILKVSGVAEYVSTPGNISAKILYRTDGDMCDFYTISEWTDLESIRKFAGEDYEKAKYYPEDEEFLQEFEEKVLHFETIVCK